MIRSLVVITSWILGFVLACLLTDRLLPDQLPWLVREKVAHLATHGKDYDIVFIGSSRMANHVNPHTFDETAAGKGLAVHSFNAGIPGMFTPQDDYVLDRILKAKDPRIRWVVLELQPLQTGLPKTNQDILEYFYWHDWPRFWLLCHRLAGKSKRRHWQDRMSEIFDLLPELGGHALLFGRRLTNLGRGTVPLHAWLMHEPPTALDWSVLGENQDGWSLPKAPPKLDPKKVASLDQDMEQRRKVAPTRDSRDPATEHAYEVMVEKIRAAGATPVLLIPPNAARGTYFYPEEKLARGLLILDFCDPRKYPVLFETRYRQDTSHLNPEGAEIFTRLVAERFVEAVQPTPERPGN